MKAPIEAQVAVRNMYKVALDGHEYHEAYVVADSPQEALSLLSEEVDFGIAGANLLHPVTTRYLPRVVSIV